jgi:hypothetical protein
MGNFNVKGIKDGVGITYAGELKGMGKEYGR